MRRIVGWALVFLVIGVLVHLGVRAAEGRPPCPGATMSPREEDAAVEAAVRAAAEAMGLPDREPDRDRTVRSYDPGVRAWGGEWAWTTMTRHEEGVYDVEAARRALEEHGFRVVDDRPDIVMERGPLKATVWTGIPADWMPRATSVTIRGGCRPARPGERAP